MTKDFTPAPNAIIVDAAFLNFITSDFKTNFERILNRELSTIDLSSLFTYIALDWGVTPGENQIDVYESITTVVTISTSAPRLTLPD